MSDAAPLEVDESEFRDIVRLVSDALAPGDGHAPKVGRLMNGWPRWSEPMAGCLCGRGWTRTAAGPKCSITCTAGPPPTNWRGWWEPPRGGWTRPIWPKQIPSGESSAWPTGTTGRPPCSRAACPAATRKPTRQPVCWRVARWPAEIPSRVRPPCFCVVRAARRARSETRGWPQLIFQECRPLHAAGLIPELPGPDKDLTPRQRAVLEALAEGLSVKQVAARLGLSTHTVNDHVKNLHRLFGVRNRAQLLRRIRD